MKLFSTIKNTTTLLGVLFISAYGFAQDDCATSIPVVDLSGVVCATSAPSLTDQMAAGACEEGSLDTWFSFVAQGGSADITVSNNLSGWRPEFMVTSEPSNSCVGPFTAEDCIDQNGNYNTIAATSTGLIIGNTYWIIVSSNNDNTGGTISVCVDNPAVVVNCVDNEECSTAEVLALNAPDSGPLCLADCNNGATPGPNFTGNFCEDQLNPTVWYQFTIDPTTVGIDIDLSSVSDLSDPEFVLFTTPDCLTYTIVECVEGTGGNAQSLNLVVSPGTTYFISISDATGDEGDFDLCISQFSDQSPCNTNSSIVESSSSDPSTPVGGPYSYGEVVSFCYNITDWQIGASSNWLSGIVPTFGSGWDPASFDGSGMPLSISVPLVTAGSITNGTGGYAPCNGETAGWWVWHPAGDVIYNDVFANFGVPGALPDGTPLAGGWYFETNYNLQAGNCSDQNDPNLVYGDNNWQTAGISTLDWDICFELIAGPVGNCTTGLTDLTVGMQTYADGEIGAWTSLGCVGNAQQVFPATLACCPVFDNPGDQFICDSYTLPIITGSLLTGNEAFYTGAGGTGTMYSSGNILNWSDFGAYPVTLYIYDATVPCGLEVPFELTIGQTPAVTMTALIDLCLNAGNQVGLSGGTIAGGVYSGPGVTDNGNGLTYNFDPSAAGTGTHTITYTVITLPNPPGCSSFDTDDVEVFALPVVTFTAPADLCIDAGVQSTLGGATPAGGIYSGAGVTDNGNGTDYDFDPAAAGVGIHTITYTYTDGNGCTAFDTDDVEVFALPTVTFTAPADLCIDAGVQATLGGATPVGGIYSGPGVADNGNGTDYDFDPASAGVGSHTITYTFTDGNSCTNSANDDVEVFALPTVTFTALADLCIDAGVQAALGGATPAGGVYSGPGVTDNGNGTDYDFDPASAGVGTHTITYTYTDGSGCTAFDTDDVEVFALPVVTFTAPADLCIDAGVQATLGGATPAGGIYSGPGVTDNGNGTDYDFDPASAGVGTHTITYTFTDGNSCTNSANDDLEVFALPTLTFTALADLCIDAGVQAGLGVGTPAGGVYSGTGVTDDGNGNTYSFDPAAAGVGTNTITYTFTDGNSCTNSANDDVEVFALPVLTFTAPADLCIDAGLQLGLGAATPTGGVYSGTGVIDNGNGLTYSFDPAAAGSGIHTIQYDYTDVNGCSESITDDIEVMALPLMSTSQTPLTGCDTDDGIITVTGAGATGTVDWTGPSSGTSASVTLPFDITGLAPGTYDVTFTDGTTGCTSVIEQETFINPGAPVINPVSNYASCNVDFTLLNSDITGTLLTGGQAYYTATGGPGGAGALIPNGTIYSAPTNITIYIYDENGSCSSEEFFTVDVNPLPVLTFTTLADLCIDAGVQAGAGGATPVGGIYSGTGVIDDGNGTTYSFDPVPAGVGTHTIQYDYTDGNGCSDFITDDVEVFALPVLTFTAPVDLCIDAGVQAALGGGTPAGGVYSGTGVTDDGNGTTYSFDPAAAGAGVHTITYTYTDVNGCTSSDNDDVEVFALPVVTFTAPVDLCVDAGVQAALGGGTPAGGVYSGTGVTDDGNGTTYSFDPAVAGAGVHTITYTYTNVNGCTSSANDDVEVFALPVVAFTAPTDLCIDAGVQAALGGGTPVGGVYSGTGVTDDGNGNTYSFDPAAAGAGVHTIQYDFTDGNGCSELITDDVEVFDLPTVTFTALADLCIDAGVQGGAGGATPVGGVYSGTGVTDDGNGTTYSFDPAAAGAGVHTIQYDYADGNGCSNSITDDVEVFDLPTVTFTAPADLCIDAGVQAGAGGVTPVGGIYSGTGVIDDGNGTTYSFDPAAAGAGVHTITYTYTDVNGCTSSANDDVEVFALPVVTFTAPVDLCIDAGVQVGLGGGTPAGGVYSGTGVTDNGNGTTYSFDPAAAGAGTHTITYTFTDVNGCTSSANDDVEVFALPVVVANATTITLCIGDPLTLTGSGAITYAWDNGVTDGTPFNPSATTSYTVTGTDVSGCINTDNIAVAVDPMPVVNPISPSECENVPGTGQALNIDVTGLEAGLNGSGAFIWFTDNTYATTSAPQPIGVTVNNGQTFYFEVTIGTCTLQDSVTYSVSGNIVINDPMPEFCEDPAGSGQVTGIDLNTFNNAVFAGANTYTWATGPIGVTINDGDSVDVQVTQGSCPTVNIFVHFTVHPLPVSNQTAMNMCDDGTGQATFDLTTMHVAVDGGAGNAVLWYTDGTLGTQIIPDNAFLTGPTTVYAQVTDGVTGCTDTASIILTIDALPVADQAAMNICNDGSGQATFDLTTLNGTVDGGFGNTVLWYTDGTLGAQIIPDNAFLTGATIVYAQVDDGTCTDTASIFLTVDPLPTANQTTMNVCDNGTGQAIFDLTTLNLTVDGGGVNAVLWYTDGTLGTQIVPDNAFLTGGTTIYAQVTDGVIGCTDTASITLTVDPLPTAIDLTLTPCEDVLGGQSVAGVDLTLNEASIDGGAGNTMTWYSNATLTTLVVPPTNVTVNNGDVFYVLVDNGTCTDTAMVSYTVTGTITLTNPNDSLCEDAAGIGSVSGVDLTSYNSTIFTGSGAEIFTWFDDVAMGATDSILMPSLVDYTIVSGTADTFYVYVEDGTCNNTIMVVFTVNPLPSAIQASMNLCDDGSGQATFDLTTLNITVGGGNGVLWYTDVTLGAQVVPDNSFLTGPTTVYAEVTDATTGCTDAASITLVVDPLPTALSISMNMCDDGSGQAIFDLTSLNSTVDGGAGNGVVWYTDDLLITLAVPDNAFLTGSTTVYAQVTDGVTGCADTASVTLTVDPQALIVAVSDVSVCAGDALTATAIGTGAGVITWTSDPAGVNVLETGQTYSPPTGTIGSTTYYVFEDGPCPSVMDTFIVTVGGVSANIVAAPTAGTTPLNVALDGTLSTGAIVLWEWDFDNDGILDDFNPSTSNIYTTIGSYTVALTVTDAAGCASTITITIDAFGESTLIIPNIFTPNGDGSNDVFNLSGTNITDIKGTIMNRWGQVVYQFNTLEAGWNGRTVSGLEAAEGTYFYLIDAVGADGQVYNYQGPFQLIR